MIDTFDGWESVEGLALALSQEARKLLLEDDLAGAETQLRRAIAFDTYCLPAYEWLEYVLDVQERFDEACELRQYKHRAELELALIV